MIWYLVMILGLAALFYVAIPGIGAFVARAQWRVFRRTVTTVSRYPTVNPQAASRERNVFVGLFRFFGTLEAIQGEDRIWISNGRFSVEADLRDVSVYLLPEGGSPPENAAGGRDTADTGLRSVPWSRIFSLPEGTPILVGGALFSEEGRPVFRDHGRIRLLVVIHDCPPESIMHEAIWSGRHRNEYMNAFTLPSVVTGSLSLLLLAYWLLTKPNLQIPAIMALTAGLSPVSPLLPPGFPLYFAYRHFWKKARLMRAQRDVVRLPLRFFPIVPGANRARRATLLPDMEPYMMIRGQFLEEGTSGNDGATIVTEGVEVRLEGDVKRIGVALPGGRPSGSAESVAFGAYREDGDGITLLKPKDPMAELIVVPGDPEEIAETCVRFALRWEIVSVVFISLNVAVNVPLLFFVLSLLLR